MKEIRHDLFWDAAIGLDKDVADIEPEHFLVVGEVLERLVHLQNFAALSIELLTTRKDPKQKDFCIWKFLLHLADNRRDTIHDFFTAIAIFPGVVRADHQDGHFAENIFGMPVIDSPKNMLRFVAADAEVQQCIFLVQPGPGILPGAFPSLRDGIANENNVVLTLVLFYPIGQNIEAGFRSIVARNRDDSGLDCWL